MTIALFFFIALCFNFFIFYRLTPMSIFKLNFFSYLFYFQIFLLIFLGVFFVILGWKYDDVINTVNIDSLQEKSAYIVLFVSFFSLALYFFCKLFGINKKFFENYLLKRVYSTSKKMERCIDFLLIVSIFLFIYFLIKIGGIPIFDIINQGVDVVDAAKIRSEFSLNLGFELNFIKLFVPMLFQVIYFFYFSKFLCEKISFTDAIKLLTTFVFCLISLAYAGDKAPVVFYFIGHIFCYIYIKSKINKILFAIIFLFSIILISLLYILNMKNFGDSLFISFINRVFVSQISGTYLSLAHFGKVDDFIGFSSQNASISSLFGVKSELRASERLVEYYFYDSYEAGLFKNMNSFFMHEAWANYGYFGIILSPFWVAFLISFNLKTIFLSQKNYVNIALLVYVSYSSFAFNTSFNAYIFSPQYIFLVILFYFGKMFQKNINLSPSFLVSANTTSR